MDRTGNLLLGYAESSATAYAGIAFSSRAASDAPGTLQPEVLLKAGEAPVSPSDRYGDYAGAALDPDGCTLWHLEEYAPAQPGPIWGTWVSSVRFAGCSNAPSLGGVDEQPDLTAQPASSRLGDHSLAFVLGGASVAMALVAAAYVRAGQTRR